MNLKEFQGKEYFKKYGIKVPKGFLLNRLSGIPEIDLDTVVVKAQTLTGKRKKSGLIKTVKASEVGSVLDEMFKVADEVLIEEVIKIRNEFYLSVTIDADSNDIICLFSEEGGIDIEEVERNKIKKFSINNIKVDSDVSSVIKKIIKMMKEIDAELVEINPLASTDNGLVALDSKIIIDDNSLFRQEDLSKIKETQLRGIEKDAFQKGIEYVELDGNVGVIGNGAGLVMSTLDTLKMNGIEPGNFLDVGGGAHSEKMSSALELVMEKNPNKILINIFGGITRCDEIARGIVEYKTNNSLNVPMFVRLTGSKSEEAKKILEENNIKYFEGLQEAIDSMAD